MFQRSVGIAFLTLSVVAAFILSGRVAEAQSQYVMKIGWNLAPDHFLSKGMQSIKQAVERETNKQITVELLGDGVLGPANRVVEGLRLGTVQGNVGAISVVAAFVPELQILDLPYGWESYDGVFKALDGATAERFKEAARAKGFEILDFWPGGTRNIIATRPIKVPADLKGMRIRVLGETWAKTFQAFGAVPVNMAFSEIYSALQQNAIDGLETAISASYLAKHNEQAKFDSMTLHGFQVSALTLNKTWWDRLSPALQEIVRKAARNARDEAIKGALAEDNETITALRANGITVVTDVDRAAFKAIVQKEIYPGLAARFGQAALDALTNPQK